MHQQNGCLSPWVLKQIYKPYILSPLQIYETFNTEQYAKSLSHVILKHSINILSLYMDMWNAKELNLW